MVERSEILQALHTISKDLTPDNQELSASVNRAYHENGWLTPENYWKALEYWRQALIPSNLNDFVANYRYSEVPKKVGIIMAGNIPLVGFHDLICVLLAGHSAIVKPSSDDKAVMEYIVSKLKLSHPALDERIRIVDKLEDVDAVIATGSNNTYRYFEYYFSKYPSVLRKNRKSIAVLDGNESSSDLDGLAADVFEYFGLGCRNVSLIFLPRSMEIPTVLDHFMAYAHLNNHHKFANNYTYHKAMLLMNSDEHLDTGFALARESNDLNAPLATIHFSYYDSLDEIDHFVKSEAENIQCIVGKYQHASTVAFGQAQNPELKDFADGIDTMNFLNELK